MFFVPPTVFHIFSASPPLWCFLFALRPDFLLYNFFADIIQISNLRGENVSLLGLSFSFSKKEKKIKSARTSELNGTFIYCSQLKWTSIVITFYCYTIVKYFYVCNCIIRWGFFFSTQPKRLFQFFFDLTFMDVCFVTSTRGGLRFLRKKRHQLVLGWVEGEWI